MSGNDMLAENEKQANAVAAKVMRVTFIIFTLIYILDIVGIFTVDLGTMTFAYVLGGVLLFIPTVLVNVLKMDGPYIKYVNVFCSAVFVTMLSITLTYHVVVIYVFAIAIASLYFSRQLNIFATILTVIGVSVGQVAAYYLDTLQDENFLDMYHVLVFGVVPRALVLVAVSAIFTMLCSRTATMLSNLMGAEEQKIILDKMSYMKENAMMTSRTLSDMVDELKDISEATLAANQRIARETERLLQGSNENVVEVENADSKIQDIAGRLEELSNMNHTAASLTDKIKENSKTNQEIMDTVTFNMEKICESTESCREIIYDLGEESKEIIGIINTITGISNQTNILALNAAIEAARAGENGKGFAVVAGEIQKLSEQTKQAVDTIGSIIRQVVNNTESAVEAMENSVECTREGIESIKKANKSTSLITSSNEELAGKIYAIDEAAEIIKENSSHVSKSMNQVSNNTQENCSAVEYVTAASQETTAGAESLADIVDKIRDMSKELNNVVNS